MYQYQIQIPKRFFNEKKDPRFQVMESSKITIFINFKAYMIRNRKKKKKQKHCTGKVQNTQRSKEDGLLKY